MINIDELNKIVDDKQKRKNMIYDSILQKCHSRIKKSAHVDSSKFTFFQIPNYIYGVPLYDYSSCLMYLVKQLSKNGFDVRYFHPNLLYISWDNKKSPKQEMKKTQGFKLVEDYKPQNKIIYPQKSINNLGKKLNILLDNNISK